jgi:hypothetical protein
METLIHFLSFSALFIPINLIKGSKIIIYKELNGAKIKKDCKIVKYYFIIFDVKYALHIY